MKKLFIITSFLTLFFCFLSVDAQEPENINVKNKHYYPSFSDCFYDINTFKYDKFKKIFSVDVYYRLNVWHDTDAYIKSPYDENYLLFLIFNTRYISKTNNLEIKYKGFLTAKLDSNYENIKVYFDYNSKHIYAIQKHINNFRKCLSGTDELNYKIYRQNVTKDICNAYKKRNWLDLEHLVSLEEVL